jgi:hypothetical protein
MNIHCYVSLVYIQIAHEIFVSTEGSSLYLMSHGCDIVSCLSKLLGNRSEFESFLHGPCALLNRVESGVTQTPLKLHHPRAINLEGSKLQLTG